MTTALWYPLRSTVQLRKILTARRRIPSFFHAAYSLFLPPLHSGMSLKSANTHHWDEDTHCLIPDTDGPKWYSTC